MEVWFLNLLQSLGQGFFGHRRKQRETDQEIFTRDAIGPGVCFVQTDAPVGEVSFDTIDICVRNAQRESPQTAKRCGMPERDAANRQQKLKAILHRMESKGQIKYSPPRWKVK